MQPFQHCKGSHVGLEPALAHPSPGIGHTGQGTQLSGLPMTFPCVVLVMQGSSIAVLAASGNGHCGAISHLPCEWRWLCSWEQLRVHHIPVTLAKVAFILVNRSLTMHSST